MNFEKRILDFDELPLTLTVNHIVGVLGISKQKAYELCQRKDFPSVKVGKRRILIPKPAFQKWMENPYYYKER